MIKTVALASQTGRKSVPNIWTLQNVTFFKSCRVLNHVTLTLAFTAYTNFGALFTAACGYKKAFPEI